MVRTRFWLEPTSSSLETSRVTGTPFPLTDLSQPTWTPCPILYGGSTPLTDDSTLQAPHSSLTLVTVSDGLIASLTMFRNWSLEGQLCGEHELHTHLALHPLPIV